MTGATSVLLLIRKVEREMEKKERMKFRWEEKENLFALKKENKKNQVGEEEHSSLPILAKMKKKKEILIEEGINCK